LNKPENVGKRSIVEKTKNFFTGFYSTFGLELLSTIDFIIADKKVNTVEDITIQFENWSNRKKTLFSNPRFIQIGVGNIHSHLA